MSVIDTRSHQMFPTLDAGQIETARRFASGPAREFAPGEVVFDAGVANILELTDAQLALTTAQSQVAQALAAYWIATVELDRFLGRR